MCMVKSRIHMMHHSFVCWICVGVWCLSHLCICQWRIHWHIHKRPPTQPRLRCLCICQCVCHWQSHFTYEWVMSHLKESCHVGMTHVTYERVTSRRNELFHIWISHVKHQFVMSHVKESRHMGMSHVTHMNENESWHTYERGTNTSLRQSAVSTQFPMWHDSWLISVWYDSFLCHMTHSYVPWLILLRHDSLMCDMTHSYVKWLIHMWHDLFIWQKSKFLCVMTQRHDIFHSYVSYITDRMSMWHDSFLCDMTHSYVPRLIPMWLNFMWQDSFWRCDMTHLLTALGPSETFVPHSHVWRDSFICVTCNMTHITWLL